MSHEEGSRPARILLVEDNPGDARLTTEALRETKVGNEVTVVEDGVEALAYLRREDPYADAPRPDLILLDLNLPRKDGREVLAELKQDPELERIPVVIFTTSHADQDILSTHELHANGYVTKPVDLEQFMTAVRSIGDFYLNIVEPPPRRATT